MEFNLPLVRIVLYCVLSLFSLILFSLCAARLAYTTNLPRGDTLNGGRSFHDPVVVELLFTTILTIPWSLFAAYTIHKRYEPRLVSTFMVEAGALSVLWLFWLSGAAAASGPFGSLSWCQQFSQCRLLSALVAFAWLGWIVEMTLLGFTLLFCFANKAFKEPFHGRWNPRMSVYEGGKA